MQAEDKGAAKIAGLYFAFGVAWILFSDGAVAALFPDPQALSRAQTYKGWAFVAVTAALLYALSRRQLGQLRRAREQAAQRAKMEALGRMAAGITHDFRNMLAASTGMVELARQELPEGHAARRLLDEGIRAGERGLALVRRLTDFAQGRSAALQPVELGALLQGLHPLLAKLLPPAARLSLSPAAAPLWVLAEPEQLEQALVNLVSNAGDALKPGDPGARVEIELAAVDGEARLSVSDNGQGMGPEQKSRLFEPFYTTKEPGKGVGLGLPSVYGAMQSWRGRVLVSSRLGEGSTFTLAFPLGSDPA